MPFVFRYFFLFLVLLVLLAGCGTRSISDSGYNTGGTTSKVRNPLYKGELSELAVLGISSAEAGDAAIKKALRDKRPLSMPRGSSLMLIQSGAMIPDTAMVERLSRYYKVGVFSGVPEEYAVEKYADVLRLAAAKSGAGHILVYWGMLEDSQKGHETKLISWVPFLGGIIPHETQAMDIRLKVALIDVASGRWDSFTTDGIKVSALSSRNRREASDQAQVGTLKRQAYDAAVNIVLQRYANLQ